MPLLSPYLTITNCPICKSTNVFPYLIVKKSKAYLNKCRKCHFVWDIYKTAPSTIIQQRYSSDYLDFYITDEISTFYRQSEAKQLASMLSNQKIENVFEVGPGIGTFAKSFISNYPTRISYTVAEMLPTGQELCKSAGLEVLPINWETDQNIIYSLSSTFDLVIGIHVIEHFFDPLQSIFKMIQLLKPGGFIYLHTPAHESAHDANWFHYCPEHVSFFETKTLRTICSNLSILLTDLKLKYENGDIILLGKLRRIRSIKLKIVNRLVANTSSRVIKYIKLVSLRHLGITNEI